MKKRELPRYSDYLRNYQYRSDLMLLKISPNDAVLEVMRGIARKRKPVKLLDAGCGPGHLSGPLGEEGIKVVGVDINNAELRTASRFRNFTPIRSDIRDMGFSEEFDFVICTEVIEHIPDTDVVLTELHKALKREGYALFSLPNGYNPAVFIFDHLREKRSIRRLLRLKRKKGATVRDHYHEFSINKIKRLLEGHFSIVEIRNRGFVVPTINRTIKNLCPSLFRNGFVRNILYHAVLLDLFISRLDVFHVLSEGWVILVRKDSRLG